MWIFVRLTIRIFAIFLFFISFPFFVMIAILHLVSHNLTYLEQSDYYLVQKLWDIQFEIADVVFEHPISLLMITLLVSTPFLLWLSWRFVKQTNCLKKVVDGVAQGEIQKYPELEQFACSMFKEMGASLNHMLQGFKRTQDSQQRLFSEISHELRAPLTRLQLSASLSRRKYGETKEIERIEAESKKLDLMIGDLLSLAAIQYTNNEIKSPHQIAQLWGSLLDNALFEAEQLGKSLRLISALPEQFILCYPQAICRALENIIRNAFRYSNQQIDIDFIVVNNELQTIIDDDGPGVAEIELAQIFRPFYRTADAKERYSGGTGLGLAIVSEAIAQNNGDVYAEKSHLGGLRVVIKLPLYKK